jgi:hypothetical protein
MISGKSFSERCRWVVDTRYPGREPFQYSKASSGDWVFINGDYLIGFARHLPMLSVKKFTFVIHNTDRSFGEYELRSLLPHAVKIYAINTTIRHPLLTTIPLGFVDRQLPFLESFTCSVERDIEIYLNFTTTTNASKRNDCIKAFEHDPRVVTKQNLTVPEYYNDICRSKFVLCPEGTGMDTHRVYEAILCGATPVVLRNSLSHLYERLPVCIVNSWSDSFYEPKVSSFDVSIKYFL